MQEHHAVSKESTDTIDFFSFSKSSEKERKSLVHERKLKLTLKKKDNN